MIPADNTLIVDFKKSMEVYTAFKCFYTKKSLPPFYNYNKAISNEDNLTELSQHLLDLSVTTCDSFTYKPLIIELCARLIHNPVIERTYLKQNDIDILIEGTKVLSTLALIQTFNSEISILTEHFLMSRDFFSSLKNCVSAISQSELQDLLLAFYRLISADRQKFFKFIDPQLLHTIIADKVSNQINKFIAILLLSKYLFLSEEARNQMIQQKIDESDLNGTLDGDFNVNFKYLSLIETQRLSNLSKLTSLEDCFVESLSTIVFSESDLSPGVSIISGIMVPNLTSLKIPQFRSVSNDSNFVPVPKSLEAIRSFAKYTKTSTPVLLVGTAGSGKTFLVDEMAKRLHIEETNNLVKIHLNQQTDSKTLLGTYTSGTKPGTFEWKNGVLTTAVKEGKWVLIEDIDKAPNEVLSILMGLLEHREITLPSRGEVLKAGNGFQLISTVRSQPSKNNECHLPDIIGLRLWKVLHLPDLDEKDLKVILNNKFSLLSRYTNLFISCYFAVKSICDSRKFVSMNKGAQPRQISIRDLMKFCRRCEQLFKNSGIKTAEDLIHDDVFDTVFQEAIDCFTSAIVERDPIVFLIREIGSLLQIPSSRIDLQLAKHVPTLDNFEDSIKVGRAYLTKHKILGVHKYQNKVAVGNTTSFATTNHSARLMEKIGVGISMCEPLLLVGETGTGKTTVVQQMAKMLNKKLTVINLSQQTEVGDLLGGFKPINAKTIALPLQEDFEQLFARSFSTKNNAQFLKLLSKCFNKAQWKNVCRLWKEAVKMAKATFETSESEEPQADEEDSKKKKRKLNATEKCEIMKEWNEMQTRINNFEKQVIDMKNSFVFRFVEGSLVNAVKRGDWLLLDEMNLASPETLDSISDLLAEYSDQRSVLLSEKGDVESIKAHKDFRIFGCMNPATDVGKKDLPQSIRSRFTEIYVASPDQDMEDLLMIIDKYIGKYSLSDEWIGNDVAELYLAAKKLSDSNQIVDGANQKPHFSIRTLTRTLLYARDISAIYGMRRSLYEGFCMSLLTLLDAKSELLLMPLIQKYTIGRLRNVKLVLSQIPSDPSSNEKKYIQFKHYWMQKGPEEPEPQEHYIMTPFVEKNMMNLVRASSGGRFPVLIQGPTSAGKTSMINYLAKITGHKFVRINNHEHTDLQEYLGTYVSDDSGKLIFKEGILVEALRKGHWIVLDELNLAPTDVLEALNRLLDDNRELLIPETQEVVRPHPDFMLFATQNPPGLYGGRKVLSKAFRNRFLELHFDDIPQDELEIILRERCKIAPTYAKKIVEVYKELSIKRQGGRLFEQKNSFATLRDLFRWAQREAVGYEQLAANGYMLLAERVRRPEEKIVVKEALEKVMRVTLDMDAYYAQLEEKALLDMPGPVIWTKAMRRLAVLVMISMQNNEPLLLVGETGCGKTTVCQMIAQFFDKDLIIVNAHQNTETGDLLGAQRPIRNRSELQLRFILALKEILPVREQDITSMSYSDAVKLWNDLKTSKEIDEENLDRLNKIKTECDALFEWSDGPLVNALKSGSYFLLDEISLADDSVLERLNSVLEPERSLLLAEKGSDDIFITAKEGFQFLATMNPGGDYGKKELSPALRNRFTEIWVPSMEDFEDVRQIVRAKLADGVKHLTDIIVNFSKWYGKKMGGGDATSGVISLRDILAWVTFINTSYGNGISDMPSLLHGSCMVFIDALGTHTTAYLAENEEKLRSVKLEYVRKLSEFAKHDLIQYYSEKCTVQILDTEVKCGPFSVDKLESAPQVDAFNLEAPTTASNAMRVIRALQVHKPILLEGSPGVGKTSLITALAKATGNCLTRINLSEQTDLIDLFGSDSPVEGGKAGEFVWRDAPYLRAMQKGEWVLLDEMNLASQSVLEGLNACLDHRGEVYIPELDRSFISHPNFKVFAAQNPQLQGGGRKGLPKSFINRFSVVYVDMLNEYDLRLIAHHLYPALNTELCDKMISFMSKLEEQVVIRKQWGSQGSPWEFNLRDTLRWLSLVVAPSITGCISPSNFFDLVVKQRFRSEKDRAKAVELFESIFGPIEKKDPYYRLQSDCIQCQSCIIDRNDLIQYQSNGHISSLQCNVPILETIFRCIQQAYPLILVGGSGSGKSDLIKFAADVVGSKIYEFSMNSDIDSMDILGGYEQADHTRTFSRYATAILEILLNITAVNVQLSTNESTVILQIATKLIKSINEQGLTIEIVAHVIKDLNLLNDIVSSEELKGLISDLTKLYTTISSGETNVNFEWFDGLLVEAVEKGYWLILDNANLCNPSVLDRLNSLLETNGSLVINECTNDDGSPRIIQTHPNFRLFLTSDPKYGELSRAMRNRSVEVFVEKLEVRASSIDKKIIGVTEPTTSRDSEIHQQLHALDITTAGMPLSKFASINDSMLWESSLFLDHYNNVIRSKNTFDSSAFLQFIPMSLLNAILDISTSITGSSEILSSTYFAKINQKIRTLVSVGLCDAIGEVYSEAFKKSPLLPLSRLRDYKTQPVSPITNSFLLPLIESYAPFATSSETSYLFADVAMLSDAIALMTELHEKARTASASSLNPLEQLVAVALGREIKKVPKINTYRWIRGVLEFVQEEMTFTFHSKQILAKPATFESLFAILNLWNNFVLAASTMNHTAIRVYHDHLVKWIDINQGKYSDAQMKNLSTMSLTFTEELKLTRGSSMTIIWNACRGAYPQTAVAWSNYEQLMKLAERFDEIAFEQFPENLTNINEFRRTLIDMFDSCLEKSQNDDFNQVLAIIESKISDLENISNEFLLKRAHPFTETFSRILGFRYAQKTYEESAIDLDKDSLTLSLLAKESTLALVESRKTDLFKPYPNVLRALWNNDGELNLPLFDDQFLKANMKLISRIERTEGGNIEQTLHDLKFLIYQLVQNSNDILADHASHFFDIIQKWVSHIHLLHAELLESEELIIEAKLHFSAGDRDSLQKYGELFVKAGYTAYSEVFEKYFVPVLLMSGNQPSLKTLGECFILASCGFIMLYMPDSAYDPAAVDHILYNDFVKLQTLVCDIYSSFEQARENYFGDSEINADSLLLKPHDNSITEAPRVFRDSAPADRLFEEWHLFFSSYMDDKHIKFLLETAQTVTDRADSQIDNFNRNASQFILRLRENHLKFSDLNDILIGFIYSMKLGLHLLHSSHTSDEVKSPSSLWTADSSFIFSTTRMDTIVEEFQKMTKKSSVNDYNIENVYAYLLLLSKMYKSPTKVNEGNNSFNRILTALYYRWSLRRLKEQERESTESGVFKFADPTMDAEADFKKLFPDSEEIIDLDVMDTSSSSLDMTDIYYHIAKAYVLNFKLDRSSSMSAVAEASVSSFNSLAKICEVSGAGTNTGSIMAFTLSLLKSSYNKFTEMKSARDIDFYRGYDFAQTRVAGKVVRNVQVSVHELLKKWPEHATLSDLFRICSEFLAYPASTPIFRLLAKVEQIFTFIAEWEKYAHSGVSLAKHYQSVSGLIVSWRQLELASWKQVFIHEDENIEKGIGKWWFHLFETIVVPSMNDEIFDEEIEIKMIAAINIFVSQASYGDFYYRLDLLSSFANHVQQLVPASPIYSSLMNIVTYYSQFLPQINESIAYTKKDLEKKVNEIILLASWKDVNIDALKQSSRRSHHKLYNIIRKYRDCLVRPVKPLIETGLTSGVKTHVQLAEPGLKVVRLPEDLSKIDSICARVSTWTERKPRMRNIEQVEKNLNLYIGEIKNIPFRSLHEYAKSILEDAEELRRETPSTYTKENKKIIASLKNEKHMLLSNTIKDLKKMGLKLHMTSDIQKALPSVTAILATALSLENTSFKGYDAFFFRILDLLPRLRASVSEVHVDIAPSDAQKCLAASEHLLFNLMKNRTVLSRFSQFNASLHDMINNLEIFTTHSENKLISSAEQSSISSTRQSIHEFIEQAPSVIDFAIESLTNASQFTGKTYDASIFTSAKSFVEKLVISNHQILGSLDAKNSKELLSFYQAFVSNLSIWKSNNHEVAFVADFILQWLESQNYKFDVTTDISNIESHNMEDLEHAFRDIFNSILVSVQRIHKFNFEEEKKSEGIDDMEVDQDDDDEKWLTNSQKKLNKYVDLLYPASMTRKAHTIINILRSIEFSEEDSVTASAIIEHALPIIQHYFNLVQVIECKLKNNYVDVSRGSFELSTILYTICSKGFCQPEPPSEEKEDNNLKEGTGLGDGEGAENNSNDVEDDEDLSEQAQQPNEEKNRDDQEEENDDAVDIEGEMGGELENVSDQEKEDEDEDDKEDEEELDEEIDDLDDMDPNAVDDKMWDEEASSNSKEKESDEMPDNSEANDDMQAKEDDDDEKENDQKNESKEDGKEDDKPNDNAEEDDKENDDNAEDEEDVGEQEDEVKNDENEQFDNMAPEADALELPDDINLDSEGDDSDGDEENDDKFEDDLDDGAEEDDTNADGNENADVEMDKEEPEGDEENEEVEGAPADSEVDDEEGEENQEDEEGMEVDKDEINEEAGEDSDEELKGGEEGEDEDNKQEEESKNDAEQEEIEGLEGAETGANDIDDDSAVKQQSGTKSEGADADANEEKEDVGASNGGADFQNEEKEDAEEEDQNPEQNEASRDQAAESMKQLGDSLKEFHRRRQEIKEATDDDMVDQKTGEAPDEFQHLEGDNAENETQALGAANKEQIQSINDDMAIDDDEDEQNDRADVDKSDEKVDPVNNEEDPSNEVADVEMEENDDDFAGEKRSGFMNERNAENGDIPIDMNMEMDIDLNSSEEEEFEDGLHIDTPKLEQDLRPYEEAEELWRKADDSTRDLTSSLCEQLRLILEPTLSTKLKGDYKTGKRLNMKRIIPYIASQFRKDKIWMRRTKPSKRQYQIMISLDDSKSMSESHAVDIAFESVALVSKSLSQLESGQISIMKFGSDAEVVHPFEKQFGANSGINVFREFKFDDTRTDIKKLVSKSLKVFNEARATGDSDLWQLEIVLSDGVCEDHETIQRLVRRAREEKVMIVFVVIDGLNSKESILDMSQASYTTDESGKMKLQVNKYLDTFPFEFYVVVHHINELPEMLSLILRQYFTELASS